MTTKEKQQRWLMRERIRCEADREIELSKNKMASETGVPRSHPKFEKAWSIAWEAGHASGMSEVECYFVELAELLKP